MRGRKQLVLVVLVAIIAAVWVAPRMGVNLRELAKDCVDLLRQMWRFFTGLFRMI